MALNQCPYYRAFLNHGLDLTAPLVPRYESGLILILFGICPLNLKYTECYRVSFCVKARMTLPIRATREQEGVER